MYVPSTGRFLSRDPLPENGIDLLYEHAYVYARSNPVIAVDPSGRLSMSSTLSGHISILRGLCLCWGKNEETVGILWVYKLRNCPCNLTIKDGKPQNPDAGDWEAPSPAPQPYHPGATWCMRSRPIKPFGPPAPGQQCCYDKEGKLITGSPGAGTPDKVAPTTLNFLVHVEQDMDPWKWCYYSGLHKVYLKYRPPNKGWPPCDENVPVSPDALPQLPFPFTDSK